MDTEKIFKIILLGDGTVGKTSIRYRYMGMGFRSNYLMTLGADFSVKRYGSIILHIWDIAGTKAFSNIRKDYYQGANGALLVFDIFKRSSFDNLTNWIKEMEGNIGNMIPTVIMANKIDLLDKLKPEVIEEDIIKFKKNLEGQYPFDFPFIKTSALTGFHIDEAFEKLIKEMEIEEKSIDGTNY